jgi:hypothetical protein
MSKTKLVFSLKLYDDESVREKLKFMTKWETMVDDLRNCSARDMEIEAEKFLEVGKEYTITIEEKK